MPNTCWRCGVLLREGEGYSCDRCVERIYERLLRRSEEGATVQRMHMSMKVGGVLSISDRDPTWSLSIPASPKSSVTLDRKYTPHAHEAYFRMFDAHKTVPVAVRDRDNRRIWQFDGFVESLDVARIEGWGSTRNRILLRVRAVSDVRVRVMRAISVAQTE